MHNEYSLVFAKAMSLAAKRAAKRKYQAYIKRRFDQIKPKSSIIFFIVYREKKKEGPLNMLCLKRKQQVFGH
jgi:hypothetical protein